MRRDATMMAPWFMLLCGISMVAFVKGKCLTQRPDVKPKRHFYLNGQSLPLTIETSDRLSQRLSSHVLHILLTEILGYQHVDIKSGYNGMNASHILNRLAGYCTHHRCPQGAAPPETMINLEIWMGAGFNMEGWVNQGSIIDAGPLGPKGRFGWYMPSFVVEDNWDEDEQIVDHWRALKLKHVTEQFKLMERQQFIEGFLTHKQPGQRQTICSRKACDNGVLYGPNCPLMDDHCALLLSSYPELDGGYLGKQVENLGLGVNIAWIGSRLNSFVEDCTSKHEPALFFNWEPNALTALGNYTRIKFPFCSSNFGQPANCDYEVHQLSKAMWSKMRTHAPEAAQLISNLHFSQDQYEDLLRLFVHTRGHGTQSDKDIHQVACQWVRENSNVWDPWIPENLSNKTRIYIGALFPISGRFWRMPGIVPGATMGMDVVNRDPNILGDYELILLSRDTQCQADIVMKQFMQFLLNDTHPIAGILGPGCSETESIVGVSKHFNTIIVSYSSEVLPLGLRQSYPLFFRTVPQLSQNCLVYLELFARYNWKQVALLAEDIQNYPEYNSFLRDKFLNHGISVIYHRKMPQLTEPQHGQDAAKFVEGIKQKNARIIIVTSYEVSASFIICEAYRQHMTARQGYVWFLPAWFTRSWWDTDTFNKVPHYPKVPCSTWEMLRAIQGHLTLSNAIFDSDDAHIIGNMTVRQWKYRYRYSLERLSRDLKQEIELSQYASYAYDAVWVFALALHQLLEDDPSALESLRTESTTQRFMYFLNKTHFQGASGPVRFMGADRTGIININQFMRNHSHQVGQYIPDKNESERLQLNDTRLKWLSNGKVPSDGRQAPRECALESLRSLLGVHCDIAIVIANLMGVGAFGLFMVVLFVVFKKRYDAKVRATRERMEQLGLMPDETSWLCLDQWEVPRDHVVLNRKLGEGAFGTVYGGEALMDDSWVAVAVKTLKIGSNPEEKLDFLSEAEMMKRFDHENIVKLLGVCTRGEPAYTIMEFMLHGDLKTFLLARRQLVGHDTKEAEDITPAALTRMALDVAYGLKYLTDLKYVHRDLACRNCLVHADKKVKIGDFGMTRLMYDSDYYRFNKRGMLPVRWMAPESLSDGLFTPMSDVWSYGILLYEIMTFGSFPYQGQSNKQVLEHVKSGHTIHLPAQCSSQLRTVLMSCWSYDPERRPIVDDVIVLFKNHMALLKPCLDAPLSSVALEGTWSLEMAIPSRVANTSKLRAAMRTTSEHAQLHYQITQDRRSSTARTPTSTSMADPFSLLSSGQGEFRLRNNSAGQQSCEEHTETVSAGGSVESDQDFEGEEEPGGGHCPRGSPKSSSPDSPIQLRYIALPASLEDKADSDYCSDHSKEFWHNNGTSVI